MAPLSWTVIIWLALNTIVSDAATCNKSYTDKTIRYIEDNKALSTIYYLGTKSSATECVDSCMDFNYLCDKSSLDILDNEGASINWNTEDCEITIYGDTNNNKADIKITDEPILSSNYIIEVELTHDGGLESGFYWKSNNYWNNFYDYFFGIDPNDGCVTCFSDPSVSNGYTELSDAEPIPSYNKRHTLKATVSGNTFTTYLDGEQHYSGTLRSSHSSYGWCGIWSFESDATYHSFKITFPYGGSEEKICAAYLLDSSNKCYGYYGTEFSTIESSVTSKSNYDSGIIYPSGCPTTTTTFEPTSSPTPYPLVTMPPIPMSTLMPSPLPTSNPVLISTTDPSDAPTVSKEPQATSVSITQSSESLVTTKESTSTAIPSTTTTTYTISITNTIMTELEGEYGDDVDVEIAEETTNDAVAPREKWTFQSLITLMMQHTFATVAVALFLIGCICSICAVSICLCRKKTKEAQHDQNMIGNKQSEERENDAMEAVQGSHHQQIGIVDPRHAAIIMSEVNALELSTDAVVKNGGGPMLATAAMQQNIASNVDDIRNNVFPDDDEGDESDDDVLRQVDTDIFTPKGPKGPMAQYADDDDDVLQEMHHKFATPQGPVVNFRNDVDLEDGDDDIANDMVDLFASGIVTKGSENY